MKITVFTSNQPRHTSFIHKLSALASEVYAVTESSTLFPGAVADSIYNQSPVMKRYFDHVTAAEHQLFGDIAFSAKNVRSLNLKMGDIRYLQPNRIHEALHSDYYIVFGAGFIKPPLVDFLIEKCAVNIHMGVSPYFRGSSCNFWAIHDGYPELVGATIHLLSRGLDSGDILFHALPKPGDYDPFFLGMKAVEAAQTALCDHIKAGSLLKLPSANQDKSKEIRYSRYTDFNDTVAQAYLNAMPTPQQIGQKLQKRLRSHALTNPAYSE